VNDCIEHLVFEAHLLPSAGSHLNATCVDHVTHLRSFVTRELFDRTISEVKVEVAGMCLFLVLFFIYVFILYEVFASMSMDLMQMLMLIIADVVAMMVMEMESRFPPSEVMDALSIVYPQFWLQPGHKDKLTEYMHTLKQTYAHTKDFSSATHVCDICPAVLSAMALDRQLHWFVVAMANNSPHAMRALGIHIHPLTKLWRALA
jgi:hypothetical protein